MCACVGACVCMCEFGWVLLHNHNQCEDMKLLILLAYYKIRITVGYCPIGFCVRVSTGKFASDEQCG